MQFVLNEVLDVPAQLSQLPAHAELDSDTIAAILEEGGKFASEVLLPLNSVGDRQGCALDTQTHEVSTPEGFKQAFENMWKVDGLHSVAIRRLVARACPWW